MPPSGRTYHVVPGPPGAVVAAATVIDSASEFACAGLPASLMATVKFDVPVAVGVPEMIPVEAPSVNPAGRLPEATDHVYDGVPPLACSCVEYAVPSVPEGSEEVVIARDPGVVDAELIVMDEFTVAVWAGLLESSTVSVKAEVPLAVGVPEMIPVEALSVSPAGRLPAVTDHV